MEHSVPQMSLHDNKDDYEIGYTVTIEDQIKK